MSMEAFCTQLAQYLIPPQFDAQEELEAGEEPEQFEDLDEL